MSSSSTSDFVSPRGSSSDISQQPHKKHSPGPAHFPPPFWQEKIARSYNILKLLDHNPDLRFALHKSPTLAGEFMKHPDVGREVARDKKLATEIIRRPHLLKELANFHHYAHLAKRREKVREFVKHLEIDYLQAHVNESGLILPLPHKHVVRSASESDISVAIGRATIPNIPDRRNKKNEPQAIKYLIKASRLYLRHDVTIEDGFLGCCNKKTSYYNILNSHGRLMYRVFMRHKQSLQQFCRPFELVVKDPDGHTMFLFTQTSDIRFRTKVAVQYPRETIIGYVEHKRNVRPSLNIRNKENECMIQVACLKRPTLSYCCYHPEFCFELRAIGAHNVIGKISAEWIDTPVSKIKAKYAFQYFNPGAFANERIYGVNFPRGLTPEVKVTVMAAWMLVYLKYYSGKMDTYRHHTLSPEQMALIHLAEDSEDEQRQESSEPSSDSDRSRDDAMMNKYRKAFDAAAAATAIKSESHDNELNYNV